MVTPGVTVLKEYYVSSCTLEEFVVNKKFCGLEIPANAASLRKWLKTILVAFPRSAKGFEKQTTVDVQKNYDRDVLPAIKSAKKKVSNDVFNMSVKNVKGKVVGENWKFFQGSEWIKLHKYVGDVIIQYVLQECAIFKIESRTLLQKSGISVERLHLKSYCNRKEAASQQKQMKEGGKRRKRKFVEDKEVKDAEPAIKKRKIEEGKGTEVKRKKTYRGRKKKGKYREKIIPGFQYSLQIPYVKVMYNAITSERFPSTHVLNTKDVYKLTDKIFSIKVEDELEDVSDKSQMIENKMDVDLALKNDKIRAMLELFVKKHSKFDYQSCVGSKCPVKKVSEQENDENCQFFNSRSQILNFLASILHNVVPTQIFGSVENKRIMYRNLKTLIFSGRYDKLCLGQFMMNFRIKDCKWIGKEDGISTRQKLIAKMILWLLTDYFMVILKNFFYVTDTSFGFSRLYYYRQNSWRKLREVKVNQLTEDNIFVRVESKEMIEKLETEGFGVGNLRFNPKRSGLRPLVTQSKKNESVLEKLQVVLCTLRYAIRKKPELIGFGTQNVRSATEKWALYKRRITKVAGNVKFYFVKIDVKDCFHSMIQKKLLEILERVYDLIYRKTSYIQIAKVHRLKRLMSGGVFHRRVFIAGDMRDTLESMLGDTGAAYSNGGVLVDTGNRFIMPKPSIRSRLSRYVRSLLCTLPKKASRHPQPMFHQIQGVVQGQMLSSILCDIYYGAMDEEYLAKYTKRAENFLIRLIDDYLFVTPDVDEANRFLAQMTRGINDFNSNVNSSKCSTNLPNICEIYPEIQILKDDAKMSWLGNKIDTKTLDFFDDFSRYGQVGIESATVHQFWKPTKFMKEKLVNSLRLKSADSIYFDESCNSSVTVAQNIYELFLITAFRFVCHVRFAGRKKSEDYICDVIHTCSDCVFQTLWHLKKRQKDAVFSFTKSEVSYLSLLAFETKFMRLLKWRPVGRRLRNRRKKLFEKTRQDLVSSVKTFPQDFSNIVKKKI